MQQGEWAAGGSALCLQCAYVWPLCNWVKMAPTGLAPGSRQCASVAFVWSHRQLLCASRTCLACLRWHLQTLPCSNYLLVADVEGEPLHPELSLLQLHCHCFCRVHDQATSLNLWSKAGAHSMLPARSRLLWTTADAMPEGKSRAVRQWPALTPCCLRGSRQW